MGFVDPREASKMLAPQLCQAIVERVVIVMSVTNVQFFLKKCPDFKGVKLTSLLVRIFTKELVDYLLIF